MSTYGYCPKCGAPGKTRERRPNGNDTCEKGCTYPSRDAVRQHTSKCMIDITYGLRAAQTVEARAAWAAGRKVFVTENGEIIGELLQPTKEKTDD